MDGFSKCGISVKRGSAGGAVSSPARRTLSRYKGLVPGDMAGAGDMGTCRASRFRQNVFCKGVSGFRTVAARMPGKGRAGWPYVRFGMDKLEASVNLSPDEEIGLEDSFPVVLRLCSVFLQMETRGPGLQSNTKELPCDSDPCRGGMSI